MVELGLCYDLSVWISGSQKSEKRDAQSAYTQTYIRAYPEGVRNGHVPSSEMSEDWAHGLLIYRNSVSVGLTVTLAVPAAVHARCDRGYM
jgi:hypothetical protein